MRPKPPDVDAFQEPLDLLGGKNDLPRASLSTRPREARLFKPLLPQGEPRPVPVKCPDAVPTPAQEQEERRREGAFLDLTLHKRREASAPFAKVDDASMKQDPRKSRERPHDKPPTTRASQAGSHEAGTSMARPVGKVTLTTPLETTCAGRADSAEIVTGRNVDSLRGAHRANHRSKVLRQIFFLRRNSSALTPLAWNSSTRARPSSSVRLFAIGWSSLLNKVNLRLLQEPKTRRGWSAYDDGRGVSFNVGTYAHIEHGYASTVYKAQGSTIERVFVAHTPGMGREAAYVAMSRHRVGVELHVAKDAFEAQEWGKIHEKPVRAVDKQMALQAQLDGIVAQAAKDMERTQEKAMSVEYNLMGTAIEVVPSKEKEQAQSREVASEKAKTHSRGRGRSFGW